MFGRKYKSIEKKLDETVEECAEILASFEVRLSEVEKSQERLALRQKAERDARIALANREARHEMRVKERMDEYASAILANEAAIGQFSGRSERKTISNLVQEQARGPMSTAQIVDEWVNGKEGTDDE